MSRMILSSWKEIAQYVGKGVRTVQRWEGAGFPIRRPNGGPHVVIAYTHEIDAWLGKSEQEQHADLRTKIEELESENRRLKAQLDAVTARLHESYGVHELLCRSHRVLSQSVLVQRTLAETLKAYRGRQRLTNESQTAN